MELRNQCQSGTYTWPGTLSDIVSSKTGEVITDVNDLQNYLFLRFTYRSN